jgi:sugar lactone lactonase YvrE
MLRPVALTVDSFGNIYVADTYRKAILVYNRLLEFSGTLASSNNDLNEPVSLALSRDNNLYVSSSETRSIVEIRLAGMLRTAPTGSVTFQTRSGAAITHGVLGY